MVLMKLAVVQDQAEHLYFMHQKVIQEVSACRTIDSM